LIVEYAAKNSEPGSVSVICWGGGLHLTPKTNEHAQHGAGDLNCEYNPLNPSNSTLRNVYFYWATRGRGGGLGGGAGGLGRFRLGVPYAG